MKANEAPEKIYLNPIQDALTEMLSTKVKGDIEYTRTDAFIEKACEYLMEYEFNDSPTIIDRMKRVETFKIYMEGV